MNMLIPQTPGLPGRIMFVDLYHGDNVVDFSKARAFGCYGVIHKSDQGLLPDPAYRRRREMWLSQPPMPFTRDDSVTVMIRPLWGAYDFNTGDKVADQVAAFLRDAMIDDQTLACLDFEDNSRSQMSLAQAVEWLQRVADATGQRAKIYSGNRLKEAVDDATDAQIAVLERHDLWLCQYGPHDVVPWPWHSWEKSTHGTPNRLWAWQRDADGVGPDKIKTIPGIEPVGKIDENVFDGTPEDLQNTWVRKVK